MECGRAGEPHLRLSFLELNSRNRSNPLHLPAREFQDLVLRHLEERHDAPIDAEERSARDTADTAMADGDGIGGEASKPIRHAAFQIAIALAAARPPAERIGR